MISARGLQLLRESEDLRLEAYPDPASGGAPWTIGYGHTLGVKPGDTCTREQAEAWLLEDAAEAEGHVDRLVKVPLTQGQRDALISFVFNLGGSRLEESTLLRKLNAGDYEGAAAEFPRWNKGAGKVMPGLVKRRAREAALFRETQEPTEVGSGRPPVRVLRATSQAMPERNSIPIDPINAPQGEAMDPLSFAAVALPKLMEAAPELIRIFGTPGSPTTERNAKALEMVSQIAVESTASQNVQEAVEQVQASPEQAKAFREAVQENWFALTEVGGGVQAARKADAAFIASGAKPVASPAFLISLILLVMPFLLLVDVFFVHSEGYAGELRTQIVTGVLMVIGMVGGFWLGSSFGSHKKDERT